MWLLLLLILPIWLVLAWLHLRIFKDRLGGLDVLLVALPLVLSMLFGAAALHLMDASQGLWDEIVAALGAYLVLACGFGLGVGIRHAGRSDREQR